LARECRARSNSKNQAALFNDGLPRSFWQIRLHGFKVFSRRKYVEKLRYIHRNPVKRGGEFSGIVAVEQLPPGLFTAKTEG
jgi:REP element-mobilizing transposase RayT